MGNGVTGAAKGGRDIVAYFAGHLAHIANGDDGDRPGDTVMVKPFQLFERVHRALVANKRYLDHLVGLWAYPPPGDPDDAADFYFDQVIDRAISGRPGAPTSADNLARFVASLAATPGEGKSSAASLWKAIVQGPEVRRRLPEGKAIFEYSNLILKCLDATNRPYAEVIRLGLCPREWLVGDGAVGVNTLKSANGFIKALKGAMNDDLGRRPSDAELQAAYAVAPVPGSPDVAAFVRTPLGAAALARIAGRDQTYFVSFDAISDTIAETVPDDSSPPMDGREAGAHLEAAVVARAIAPAERVLLAAIMDGVSIAEALGANPFLRRRIRTEFNGDVSAFVDDLAGRAARFAARDL
jgi:hypothetical protein